MNKDTRCATCFFFQSVNAQICVIPANLWLIRFVSWDFFSRLVSIKYFYLDSQINWLPSIRMTCCITGSTPHASLTKWKIINSLHGQVSIQCWSAPFSAITYAQVIVFLAKIEHECYLFCRAYHASLFSVLIQLMLQINYAITIFFLYIGNTHGCKDNSLFFVKHNILVIGTRKQWIGYHTELVMEACLFALAPAMLCHVCSYWHLPYFHNSQHPACPFSTKFWYLFLWCTDQEFGYQFCKLFTSTHLSWKFLSVQVVLLNLRSGLLNLFTGKQLLMRRLCETCLGSFLQQVSILVDWP